MKKAEIYYFTLTDEMPREDKLAWFENTQFKQIEFDKVLPDEKGNWLNLTDNDFESLMPLIDKDVKANKSEKAIFKLFSTGVLTARDECVYDFEISNLKNKVEYFFERYNNALLTMKINNNISEIGTEIKWSRNLKNYLTRGIDLRFEVKNIVRCLKRPFYMPYLYFDKGMNDEIGYFKKILQKDNKIIGINNGSDKFASIVSSYVFDFASLINAGGQTQCMPLYNFDETGNRHDNITDWALNEFKNYYENPEYRLKSVLQKIDIFHYVYAVLHNPEYRTKYELNLKRDFPRVPLYKDFWQWVNYGQQLMELHLNYETIEKYPLTRIDLNPPESPFKKGGGNTVPNFNKGGSKEHKNNSPFEKGARGILKAKLKADKIKGLILIDDKTHLSEIPELAWEYKLGNRSALEWILDQYKEKTPKDKIIAEQFNSYRFSDYKEFVIDLLMRVTMVSIETVKITNILIKLE
ncbi:MAG: hypothetical protein RL637_1174 [Pseudomonadota bacterium]